MDTFTLTTIITSAFILLLTVIYWRIRKAYDFFAKKDVSGPSPAFPLGTWNYAARQFIGDEDVNNIEKFGEVVGTFDGLTPNLLITNNEIVQRIVGSDNSKFRSRRVRDAKNKTDRRILQILDEQQPKDITALLSGATNRINKLVPQIEVAAKALVRGLEDARKESKILSNSLVGEFIENVTATVILGLDLNHDAVFRQRFVKQCKLLLPVSSSTSLLAAIPYLYGGSANSIFSRNAVEYFKDIIATRVKDEAGKEPVDKSESQNLVDILVALASEEKKVAMKEKAHESEENAVDDSLLLTEDLITDVILATVIALIHYVKSNIVFSIQALSTNPAVLEKLSSEAKRALESNQELKKVEITAEKLEKLQYLNAFLKEVNRMYPTEFRVEKVTTENIEIAENLNIEVNAVVSIPVYALLTSNKFHTDPQDFSPQRFLSDNYEKQHPIFELPQGWAILSYVKNLITKTALYKIAPSLTVDETVEKVVFQKGLNAIPIPSI